MKYYLIPLIAISVYCTLPFTSLPAKAKSLSQTLPVKGKTADPPKYQLTPTVESSSPTGLYIPKDLSDALLELDRMLPSALKAEMKRGKEQDMWKYHLSLGMWIRNNWGLWKGLQLAKWFNARGIDTPDNMSGIILTSYWRNLHGQPIKLDDQIKQYQEAAKQALIFQKELEERTIKSNKAISKMMVNAQVEGEPEHTILFNGQKQLAKPTCYLAPYSDGALLMTKWVNSIKDNDFYTLCYFFDPKTTTLRQIQLPEIENIRAGIVLNGKAYFYGTKQGKEILMEVAGTKRTRIPLPPGEGRLQLGLGENKLLAIRLKSVYSWSEGKWNLVYQGSTDLPQCAQPPQQIENRLYFHEAGIAQSGYNQRLCWLELHRKIEGIQPEKQSGNRDAFSHKPVVEISQRGDITYFDKHIELAGVFNHEWENIWSYAGTGDGTLWLTTGSYLSSQSLIMWHPGNSYRVVLFNDLTNYDGNDDGTFLPFTSSQDDTPRHFLAVTGVEPQSDNSIKAIGPHGLFSIKRTGNPDIKYVIYPLLRFKDVPNGWIPNHIATLEDGSLLIGTPFGGVYFIKKDVNGEYQLISLEEKSGAPIIL